MSEDLVEDKMLAQAKAESKDPFEIARIYEKRFHEDLKKLNIQPANLYPKASECINLMQELIQKLIDSDHAYLGTDNCVYFSAQSFPGYGAISGNRLDALKPGHKFEYTEDGAKRFHADWALWKAAGGRTEMIWDSPWGKGFPGWHIECSAMSLHYLDNFVDLHLGGIDLRFPHHENERAQSNAAINQEAVALWIHGEHLLFEGRKMSKSAGNVVLVSDLLDKHLDPLSLRVCFLENRYRSQMDLSWESLKAAHTLIQRWREKISIWQHDKQSDSKQVKNLVDEIILDFSQDLDTPTACPIGFILGRENLCDQESEPFGTCIIVWPNTSPCGYGISQESCPCTHWWYRFSDFVIANNPSRLPSPSSISTPGISATPTRSPYPTVTIHRPHCPYANGTFVQRSASFTWGNEDGCQDRILRTFSN
jgi:cysteinyl-tRNA synthetase